MKLWVDDYRPAPIGWEWAKNVTEALRKIATSTQDVSVISLDHDIEHSSETFMAVVYYLEMYRNYCGLLHLPKIRIHTGNPVAAKAMYDALKYSYECEIVDALDVYREVSNVTGTSD